MPVFDVPVETTYTVGYLINRTFDLLLGAAREQLNQLAQDCASTDVTISVKYQLGQINTGTYISIDDELMYVWSSAQSSGASTVNVQRGMKGTTPASHNANSVVYVNPYFTRYQVRNTLQDEIRSWGPQVFAPMALDIAGADFVRGYDLGQLGKLYHVIDVQRSPDNIFNANPSDKAWTSVKWRVVNSANKTDFPSGQALVITDEIEVFDTPTFHVVYAAPIDVDSSFLDTDLLLQMGMDSSDLDIAPYGAAWRLASGREIRRMLTEAMGTAADLQYFPPGYMIKAADDFKVLRDSRLADAIERLRAQYPIKRL